MYHGGTHPKGRLTTMQETFASGGYNDLPEFSYDFRAPVREYGQKFDSYDEIKLYAMFVKDFGSDFCRMAPVFPADNPIKPDNFTDVRYAYRHDGRSGYLFINNYQRLYTMNEHKDVEFTLNVEGETIKFPKLCLKDKDYAFYPFNFRLGRTAVIKTALATPLCKLNDSEYIFYAKGEPMYDIEGDMGDAKLITISREDALKAYRLSDKYDGKEHLVIYDGYVLEDNGSVELVGRSDFMIKVYPEFAKTPEGFNRLDNEGELAVYLRKKSIGEVKKVAVREVLRTEEKAVFTCELDMSNVDVGDESFNDCFVNFGYEGDAAELEIDGERVSDDFFTGFGGYEVGLKRFDFPSKLKLTVFPYHEGEKVYFERMPKMLDGEALSLESVVVNTEEKVRL